MRNPADADHLGQGRLPPDTVLGPVTLAVAEWEPTLAFYRDMLGMKRLSGGRGEAELGVGRRTLLRLVHLPDSRRPEKATAGLYHFALRLPDRKALALVLAHLSRQRGVLQGAADHWVSEALYLADPEGNGIEMYVDRPREQWPRTEGRLQMTTVPLDVASLLAELRPGRRFRGLPKGTVMGHLHLQVDGLESASGFFQRALGMDWVMDLGAQARFFAVGGYHHHIGVNTWAGEGIPPRAPQQPGLLGYTFTLPRAASLRALADRLARHGLDLRREGDGWVTEDPWGVQVRLTK
jgi:catechol 2,3-dioxygenase